MNAKKSDEQKELEALRAESLDDIQKRLMIWSIRWIIGFGIIWAIVAWRPQWDWLWWVGGAVALLSLVFLLIGRTILVRRFNTADKVIAAPQKNEHDDTGRKSRQG